LVFEEPDALDIQPPIEPPPAQLVASAQPEPPAATPPAPEPIAEPDTEEPPARSRAGKKNPRGRRSSVPSWDEIMLGSSRQRD
jgi:hypothetical protein